MPKKATPSTDTLRDNLLTSVTGAITKVFSWIDCLHQIPDPPSDAGTLLQQFGGGQKALKAKAVPPKKAAKGKKAAAPAPAKKAAKAPTAPKTTKSEKSTRTKPTMPQAVAIVMGSKVMGTAEVIPLLQERGWAPETKNNLAQYISVIFSGNQGPGKIFERVETGRYKVQNPSQFTALARQYGGKSSGKADRVTSKEAPVAEDSDPPNDPDDIDTSLSDLLTGVGFTSDESTD